jgi:hypothetical protein
VKAISELLALPAIVTMLGLMNCFLMYSNHHNYHVLIIATLIIIITNQRMIIIEPTEMLMVCVCHH